MSLIFSQQACQVTYGIETLLKGDDWFVSAKRGIWRLLTAALLSDWAEQRNVAYLFFSWVTAAWIVSDKAEDAPTSNACLKLCDYTLLLNFTAQFIDDEAEAWKKALLCAVNSRYGSSQTSKKQRHSIRYNTNYLDLFWRKCYA